MSKDKTGRKYFYLVIATLVVFSIGFFVTEKSSARMQPPAPADICQETSKEIRDIISVQSPCNVDADCKFMPIACGMGCPSVNKVDESRINELLEKRNSSGNCMCTMEACMEANAICESGVCKTVPLTQ